MQRQNYVSPAHRNISAAPGMRSGLSSKRGGARVPTAGSLGRVWRAQAAGAPMPAALFYSYFANLIGLKNTREVLSATPPSTGNSDSHMALT